MKKNLSLFVLGIMLFSACSKSNASKPNISFKPQVSAEIVAQVGSESITEKDLMQGIEADIYEAEMKVFEMKYAKLQSILLEKFMQKDPNKGTMSNDEYLAKFIAKDIKISDKDINDFINDRKIPKDQVNPEIKERIKQFIESEKRKIAVDEWLAKKTKENPVEVYFPKPKRPTFAVEVGDAPFKGDKDAKVTIVEFSDFQCPFCSKGANVVSELEKKYGKKIKIAFKNFPLPFHTQAKIAAMAGLCANEQGMQNFWKLHDVMFKDQSKLDRDSLIASAKSIGLKVADFTTCLDSKKFETKVDQDMAQGQSVSVKSTPTFFINGQLVQGALPVEMFSEIIDEELAK